MKPSTKGNIIKRRVIRSKRLRVILEPNWRKRPYAYWFNAKYPDGMRRICLPFLTIDLLFR